MPKRAHTDEDDAPAKATRREGGADDRRGELKGALHDLNRQFARWVRDQEAEHLGELWADGARDYIRYVEEVLQEYKDVLDAAEQGQASAKQIAAPAPGFSFGGGSTPAAAQNPFTLPTAAGSGAAAVVTAAPTFGFGAASSSTPTFGFGASSSSAAAATATAAADAGSKPAASFGFGAPVAADDAGATATTSMFGSAPSAAGTGSFSFGAAAASSAAAGAAASAPSLLFGGGSNSSSAAAEASTAAAATEAAKPLFQFPVAGSADSAAAGAAGAASSGAFSFGAGAAGPTVAGGGFGGSFGGFGGGSGAFGGFGAPAAAADGGAGDGGGGGEEGEEEAQEPATLEVVADESTEVLFKKESKVFRKLAGKWEVYGKGSITIRREKANPGAAPLLLMTTEAGRCLISARLGKSVTAPKIGSTGKGVQMILFFVPVGASDGEKGVPQRTHILFNFNKTESAAELAEALERYREK